MCHEVIVFLKLNKVDFNSVFFFFSETDCLNIEDHYKDYRTQLSLQFTNNRTFPKGNTMKWNIKWFIQDFNSYRQLIVSIFFLFPKKIQSDLS